MPGHAVIVRFEYGQPCTTPLRQMERELEAALAKAGAGAYAGDQALDPWDGTLTLHGPDADRLFAAIRPVLEATPFMRGATVRLRYGPPEGGSREAVVVIGEPS